MECLRRCTAVTNEWIYTAGCGPIRDRFSPRLIRERTVPVAHRNLNDIINPQPQALDVYQNLLAWIEEVDLASQRGSARPVFRTSGGLPIFPDDERKWWLTDAQKSKADELQQGDEDGPASEVDAGEEETEDEDPSSDEGGVDEYAGDVGISSKYVPWSESAPAA